MTSQQLYRARLAQLRGLDTLLAGMGVSSYLAAVGDDFEGDPSDWDARLAHQQAEADEIAAELGLDPIQWIAGPLGNPKCRHLYAVEIEGPTMIDVHANDRSQAHRTAERAGLAVRSINLIG